MLTRPKSQRVKIRWLDDDKPTDPEPVHVSAISQRCLGLEGLSPKFVRQFADSTDHIPKVILCGDKVVGYIFYVLYRHVIIVESFAIDPDHQRQGYGKRLLRHLIQALPGLRRRIIAIEIPERALAAQLCLKSVGFRWDRTLKRGGREVYVMKYTRRPG